MFGRDGEAPDAIHGWTSAATHETSRREGFMEECGITVRRRRGVRTTVVPSVPQGRGVPQSFGRRKFASKAAATRG